MKITRNASVPSMTGKVPDNFTGLVRVDTMATPNAPGRASAALVTFAPGARTVWHTHPAGQTIIVTTGKGWVQRAGGPREEVGPGDTVFFDAGERHWHGATATTGMSHIAITETVGDTSVDWLDPVSDADYAG
ncbi:cupin domain-containing protein [Sphingomonas montana]|uniref:(R)-mandelonitrile lyase n=1 Tax=Sphingomonas montana TaxID=1843236 RepID=UPI00096CA65C|nr:cupin domain-containing protein [Sphingomonas montana]